MNIGDVEKQEVQGDMLKAIFAKQTELELKYNSIEKANGEHVPDIPLDPHTFEGQRRMRAIIYRITEELYEAGNCLRNKAWKTSQVPCDVDHFLEEMADSVHFVIQLYVELGLTAEDFADLYFRKAKVNKFRQKSNY
jgi:dimeric dUTPase (all-alpha-NTP-PPase superfamily)